MSEDEVLDIFFEDLELPDLVKATLKDTSAREFRRAGNTNDGATPNLNVLRTMRVSMSRRLALRRPTDAEVERLEAELEALRAKAPHARRRRPAAHRRALRRDRAAQAPPARHSPSSIRSTCATIASPSDRAASQGGDVLPDGRFGLDGRAREGPRQALLHAAAPVPEAPIRARRHRLHPPHP